MVLTDELIADLPRELLTRIVQQATEDADFTCQALEVVNRALPPGKSIVLTRTFLLELGAALRILTWELMGVPLQPFGLPSSQAAIQKAFDDAVEHRHDPFYTVSPSLSQTVLRINTERLAWAAPVAFQAEIQLEAADEEPLVEAVAQFLWANRASFPALEEDLR